MAFIAVVVVAIPSVSTLASIVTTDIFIVREEQPLDEDVYVTSVSGRVEGIIDGDLTIFTGNLIIAGRVTGSVTVFSSGSVVLEPTGRIDGSLRGAAASVTIDGRVGDDVFLTSPSVVIEETGSVGRDAVIFGGTGRVEGSVGRDVRGRTIRLVVDGSVGGDLDVATQKLEFGPQADIDKDVLYRSPVEASIADGASIGGTVTRLPTQSNFVYGIMLALANIVGFLGFVVAGIALLWAMRRSGSRAVGAVLTRPVRSLLVGVLSVVVLPAIIAVLAITLVGLPLAFLGVLLGAALFVVGPVPAVTALGNRVLLRRGGLFGAFLAGAVLWRLGIWFVPVVGGLIYIIGLVWGVGGWVLGALAARRGDPIPADLLPRSMIANPEIPPDWVPPLAPGRANLARLDAESSGGDDTLEDDVDLSDLDDGALPRDAEPIAFSGHEDDDESPSEDKIEMDVRDPAEDYPVEDTTQGESGEDNIESDGDDDHPTPSIDSWGLPG